MKTSMCGPGKSADLVAELAAALDLIRVAFLPPEDGRVDEVAMLREGLAAMLAALNDPFTNYISPRQLAAYESRKVERQVGVGLLTETDPEGRVRIVGALQGSPADMPGLQTGDELLQVDDRGVTASGGDGQVENALSGEEGSVVRLAILDNRGRRREVRLTRREVHVDHLSSRLLPEGVLLIRLSWFSASVHQEFNQQVESARARGARALLLDIRANSGGSIVATRNIFSSLCGDAVMYRGRSRDRQSAPDPVLGEFRFDLPMAVIIDGDTFSAGEVLAGALQDHRRALIVGSRSGGKGSMQQVFPIGGELGGALRITTATNCTPSGREVQSNGIEPDIEVRQPWPELFVAEGPQNLSASAREYLRELRREKLAGLHGRDPVDAVWQAGDRQLATALNFLRERIGIR
jgi:carboxyl-terminal processing protease